MIWSAHLKLTRKMGNAHEQGRMFSTSELVRGIFGMLIGFVGVGFLGKATLSSGEMDLTGSWRMLEKPSFCKWRTVFCICSSCIFPCSI